MKQVFTDSNRGTRSLCITYGGGEFLRVGNDQRGHQHIPGILDGGNIELGENIAAFDGITLSNLRDKVLAVQKEPPRGCCPRLRHPAARALPLICGPRYSPLDWHPEVLSVLKAVKNHRFVICQSLDMLACSIPEDRSLGP